MQAAIAIVLRLCELLKELSLPAGELLGYLNVEDHDLVPLVAAVDVLKTHVVELDLVPCL